MVDHLELAEQYVQEMLEKRDDIVGAFVVGSVARGDATESSDIDLGLIVEGLEGDEIQRGGIDTWRDGVYIEAGLQPHELYADVEKVLAHPFASGHVYDGLILYDPTGHYTRVQEKVREVFMDPGRLRQRVDDRIALLQDSVSGLREAVTGGDPLRICFHQAYCSLWLSSIPLVIKGITPSSTKALVQLDALAPDLKEHILAWEGSAEMTPGDAASLIPIMRTGVEHGVAVNPSEVSNDVQYITGKVENMCEDGHHREAVQLMWRLMFVLSMAATKTDDAQFLADAPRLMSDWLHAVGWEGQEVLEEKVRMAEEMVAEVEAMAAHLPSGEDRDRV